MPQSRDSAKALRYRLQVLAWNPIYQRTCLARDTICRFSRSLSVSRSVAGTLHGTQWPRVTYSAVLQHVAHSPASYRNSRHARFRHGSCRDGGR